MKYLLIENVGELEIGALTLLGGTTKDGVNTIGMFGTGNKYAISYFIRNKYELKIFSGTSEIFISTVQTKFRGKDFEVVCVNNERTSITTDMGSKWSLWMALREFYCNAIDEGKVKFELVDEIIPHSGNTQFYVEYRDEIRDFVAKYDDYFAENKKVVAEYKRNRVLEKHDTTTRIYRRGILVGEINYPSAYDYDLDNIEITESRKFQYAFQVYQEIIDTVFNCENLTVFESFIERSTLNGSFEENVNVSYFTCNIGEVAKTWFSSNMIYDTKVAGWLEPIVRASAKSVGHNLYTFLKERFSNLIKIPSSVSGRTPYKLLRSYKLAGPTIDSALKFLKKCQFPITYPVKIVTFQDEYVMAYADEENQRILISPNAVERGIQFTAMALIEEQMHLVTGQTDCSRAFQTAIFERFIDYMKLVNKHPL
jgi:hypothetical protein